MAEDRSLQQSLDFCLRIGEMLLSNGAGAADVTATMRAVATAIGVIQAHVDVTFTSLSMSVQGGPDELPVVQFRQVTHREIDYEDLTLVDHLVRDVVSGRTGLADARQELARIASSGHTRNRWLVTLGWGLMCGAVALQLGGGPAVIGGAAVAAICIDRAQYEMTRRRLPFFYQQITGGMIAAVLAAVSTRIAEPYFHLDASLVVAANIIMLLAGIGFMGAIQDALFGFFVTGSARLMEALLATVGIIAGVSGGIGLAASVGIGLPELSATRFDLASVTTAAVGGAIGAAAFGWSSYAPKRILLPTAVMAAVALVITQAVEAADLGRPWAVGVAAFVVGLFGYSVSGRMRVPPLVTVVSAIVPMLPGLSIYNGLFLLGEGGGQRVAPGLLALFTAVSIAISLAAGVILGEYVAQPVRREARRVENRLAGPRLVGVTRVRKRVRRQARRLRRHEDG